MDVRAEMLKEKTRDTISGNVAKWAGGMTAFIINTKKGIPKFKI